MEPGRSDFYKRIIENWSVEQKAKEVDVSLLQQVKALERRVLSADVQVRMHRLLLGFFLFTKTLNMAKTILNAKKMIKKTLDFKNQSKIQEKLHEMKC